MITGKKRSDVIRWFDSVGLPHESWVNEDGLRHREDGPAHIVYLTNGRIVSYYLNGIFFGTNEDGFWKFWDALTYKQREKPEILSLLVRHLNT